MPQLIFTDTYEVPPLNKAEILRYMRCAKPTAEIDELISECLDEMLPQLVYKVCRCEFDLSVSENTSNRSQTLLDLGFTVTDSAKLMRHLSGCTKLILFAATIGLAPDRLITRYGKLSPTKALCFQAIGAERIESLCDAFCDKIALNYASKGFAAKPRYSPGYGDFPLSMQREVFKALDCPRRIGVSLNDSLLMSPSKSVTALIGLEPLSADCCNVSSNCDFHLSDNTHNCDSCDKTDCLFRQNI